MALPRIQLRSQPGRLAELTEVLHKHGYTEEAITELLGMRDVGEPMAMEYPAYLWRTGRQENPLSQLTRFFFLGKALPIAAVKSLLGERLLQTLERCRIVVKDGDTAKCEAVVYPCLGQYIITDPWLCLGGQTKGKIYELGGDSYLMARVTPRTGAKDCLDLCTGSGVHAIGSALPGVNSTAIDINPRALKFTEMNAALNGVSVNILSSDLYTNLGQNSYDLITANPPFVASPDPDVLIHRSAGESGEEVPERLVAALPERLRAGGLFSMVLVYPVLESETYLDRLQRWLDRKEGWGIAVLRTARARINEFVLMHLGDNNFVEKYEKYLESYERQGIIAMESANVFIRRLPEGAPGFKVLQAVPNPTQNIRPQVERWFDCLCRYSDPTWQPEGDAPLSLSPEVASVWRDAEGQRGAIEYTDPNAFASLPIDGDPVALAELLRGQTLTWSSLQERWVSEGREPEKLLPALHELGLRRALS